MPDELLYNSMIIDTYVRLLRKKYSYINVNDLLKSAGIESYDTADRGHWFSQEQMNRFHENLVRFTGKSDISRQAGQFAASPESLGFMKKYLLGMIGPGNIFMNMGKLISNFSRSSQYQVQKINSNKVEVIVTPYEGVSEQQYQCENRVGFFEATLMTFNQSVPTIEHPECIFEGGQCCRYIISWRLTLPYKMRLVRNCLAVMTILACAGFARFHPLSSLVLFLIVVAGVLQPLTFLAEYLDKQNMFAALTSMRESGEELLDQVSVNYRNAMLVNEVGQVISRRHDNIDQVLANVIKALEARLNYDRCVILLANENKTRLCFRTGYGYSADLVSLLNDASFELDNADSKGIFVATFRKQTPFLINDVSSVEMDLSPYSKEFVRKVGAKSFVSVPIVCEGESLGILAVDNVISKKELVGSDLSLLMGIASVIGVSIRNALHVLQEREMTGHLLQAQKMQIVGQLAGGIAHDFNNLMMAISGYANLLDMRMEEGAPGKNHAAQILAATVRAGNLTKKLLTFSRTQNSKMEPVRLNQIITDLAGLLGNLVRRDVELSVMLSNEESEILADKGQIEQVLMNLVSNARDAMPQGGTVRIETGVKELEAGFTGIRGYGTPGMHAFVAVKDTGTGMDSDTIDRIFEPFFTTKEADKGTGLGLFMLNGIVKEHKGFVDCLSEPGKGTAFILYLPRIAGET